MSGADCRFVRRHPWLSLYLALLVASTAVRLLRPAPELPPGVKAIELPALAHDGTTVSTPPLRLAWRELGDAASTKTPLLLLHGSPGSSGDLRALAAELPGDRRLLIPDLPGFGASSRRLPDHSILTHARTLLAWLDRLGISRVDVVAISQGGGVAIHLTGLAPERVRSLTLLSSIGVQELELLGDYSLNHALHRVQQGLVWGLQNLVPHFGAIDRSPLDVGFARNFSDSDQRPLRGLLERWNGPTLIVHGRDDSLVPFAAAEEHHRIVPQSELAILAGDHFLFFTRPAEVAAAIGRFLVEVDHGTAVDRAHADPARVELAEVDAGRLPPPRAHGATAFFLAFLLAVATFGSEDLACVGAGLLVARGTLSFPVATLAALVGIFVGDLLLFAAGRLLGRSALRHPPMSWLVSEAAVERASGWFQRKGPQVIVASRFLPGTRLPTYVAAGVLRTPWLRFTGWFLLAAALWTPLLVGAAALGGKGLLSALARVERPSLGVLLAVPLLLWLLVELASSLASWRGRRLLLGRFRRATHWEFWPSWKVYPPIVLYILALGLRHRRLTLFTAVNPAMPAGGFVRESKAAILGALAAGDRHGRVARFVALPCTAPASERLASLRAFLVAHRLDYPVVLKPDVGERGSGVSIVRDEAAAIARLDEATVDLIAQEYVPGVEAGVFYARHPEEAHGRILSITTKEFPAVAGDGERTLEELILADDRAVCMAPTFLARFAERLDEIPPRDTVVPLVEIGNHCRGAVFRDGRALATVPLAEAIDELSRGYDGFHFGRYDLRAPSFAALAAGEGIQVLELNGVTSEMAHIYEPGTSLWTAWRALAAQWRLAFSIAAANVRRGARPTPAGELLSLVARHLRGPG